MRFWILIGILLGNIALFGEEGLTTLKQEDVILGHIKDIRIPLIGDALDTTVIKDIQLSCDCLRIVSYPRKLISGQKGELWIQFLPSKIMDYSYEIILSGNRKEKLFVKKFLLLGSVQEDKKYPLKKISAWTPEIALTVRKIIEIPDAFKVLPQKIDFKNVMNEFIILDIRDPKDYEKCYIPGSMNVPFPMIKTKTYLKNKKILIIGYGYGDVFLSNEMELLKVKEWDISLVSGGITAWKSKGGRVEGALSTEDAYKIGVSDFYNEKDDADTLLVNLSDSETEQVKDLLPYALFAGPDKSEINKKINEYASKTGNLFLKIIYFNENGKGYEKLIANVNEVSYPGFFLAGGLKSYKSFLQEILQMRSGREKKLNNKRMKGCKSCPN